MLMSKEVHILKLDDILPNRFQPRIVFDETAINELTESIKEYGVIEPIIVRKVADKFEIIAGERRYKASVLAGKDTIPAVVVDLNDKDSAEIALIENVQRQNLTPIEEAVSYKKILDMGYMNQSELAEKLGKTQSTIANKLRLLNLTDTVQEALLQEKISERHARSLLRLPNAKQNEMLDRIIKERMTVRKTDEEITKILSNDNNQKEELNIEKEENKMDNNFINQFNIPTNPIIEEPKQEVKEQEMQPAFTIPTSQPMNATVNTEVKEMPTFEPIGFNTFDTSTSGAPVATEMPKQEVVSPFPTMNEAPSPVMPQPTVEAFNQVQQPAATEIPQVQTINNEPADETNVDTPISGRFFNMFGENNEEQVSEAPTVNTEVKEEIPTSSPVGFNPFDTSTNEAPVATEMPKQEVVSPFPAMNEAPSPVMPQMQPVNVEPIPMPNIPIQPQMSQNMEPINPMQQFQLNDNQEFTNSSVVEMGSIGLNRVEEPTLQPLMESATTGPKVEMKEIIQMIRNCADQIEKSGYEIDTDELDFDDNYQVIFKITKND